MKICYIGSVYPRHTDDTEVPWLRKTVELLHKRGHDITLFVPSFRGLRSHHIDNVFVKRFRYFFAPWEDVTHDEGAPNKIHKFHYLIITLFYILFGTLGFSVFHVKNRFDIVHVHWPAPHAIFAFFAARLRKTKIILNFHGASLLLVHKYPFVRRFLHYFIKNADNIITNSSFTAQKVQNIYNKPVHIIPYGTTIEPKTVTKKTTPEYKIFSIGRLIERKGFCYLVEAMPLILKKWPQASLTIAGGGPLFDSLNNLSRSLQIENRVNICGKVTTEEKERLFSECDLFVVPSIVDHKGDTEGLGVVLIEAMTYIKPVIATDVGGIPDVVVADKSGYLIPQKNPHAIAEAVHELFSDPQKAYRLANSGFNYIQQHFSWPVVIEQLESVYAAHGYRIAEAVS